MIVGLGIENFVLNHVFSVNEGRRRRWRSGKEDKRDGGGVDAAGVEGEG